MGAALQSIIVLLVPSRYAVLPALLFLALRISDTMLITWGWKRNPYMDGAIMQKVSAQVVDKNGKMPEEAAGEKVAIMFLGSRSNHPLGLFAPGFKDLGKHFTKMTAELEKGTGDNGFLGASYWLRRDSAGSENVQVSYWRSVEDIHKFAHGPTHREAWKWWDRMVKDLDHIGINHEIYVADKGNWETIYVNFQPTMLGATTYLKRNGKLEGGVVPDEWLSPLVDASRGKLRTSAGRLGPKYGDGSENEKYGPSPYEV
jgi:hypothetical protein